MQNNNWNETETNTPVERPVQLDSEGERSLTPSEAKPPASLQKTVCRDAEDEKVKLLLDKIRSYSKNYDEDAVIRAYEFAREAHEGQHRKSGEPYVNHPIEVALIIADMQLDTESVIAGLLHDTVEDVEWCTLDTIREQFGDNVAQLVDGVTKLEKIQYSTKEEQQIENLRKMFLAMARDIRVILIKLADRLHNMRTIASKEEEKRREKARETIEVYAPLAHRLGMSKIKCELEDLSLKYLDPIAYQEISESINQKKQEREEYIEKLIEEIKEKLAQMGIKGSVFGRAKHFYSIYRKMFTQNKSIDEIYDLFAVRVIVDTVGECYSVLGAIHELFKPIPRRFKDYIAMPKPNMYQSLHSSLIGPNGTPFEVQIRTWEMHNVAEQGIAAHWKYKQGIASTAEMDQKLAWVRQLLDMQKELIDADDFMHTLKIDLFADEVFVFTPRGDVINLPNGANTIDFAFAIHSAVGQKMMGAKVNGKIVPIDYTLKNGDIIEVLTSANVHGPSRDWLKIVKTSQARNKINQWFKKECREENVERGRDLIEKELKRQGYRFEQIFRDEWVVPMLKRYSFKEIEDLYAAVGYGGITAQKVVMRLRDDYIKHGKPEEKPAEPVIKLLDPQYQPKEKKEKSSRSGVIVNGMDDCMVRFAKCCTPVPNDPIIGFITRGRGVSVHRADCPNMSREALTPEDQERLIEVKWAHGTAHSYIAELQIAAQDSPQILVEILNCLSQEKITVKELNAKSLKRGGSMIHAAFEVNTSEQLEAAIRKIFSIPGVYDVSRANTK